MRRALVAALTAFGVCSCGSIREPTYERQEWAQKGFDQASAECYTEINQRGGPPNYYLCMKAKGYVER